MSASPDRRPSEPRREVDVRTLNVAQLKLLADRGSRRARAELEGRMRATATPRGAESAPSQPAALADPPGRSIDALTQAATAATPAPARATGLPAPPLLHEYVPPAHVPEPESPPEAGAPANAQLIERLQLIAEHEQARERADEPVRLVGLLLMAWGILLALGSLPMLFKTGNALFFVSGAGCAITGWLLLQGRALALWVYGVMLVVVLAWAWRDAKGSVPSMLVTATPALLLGVYLFSSSVRSRLR